MSLRAGRVGVAPSEVDDNGRIKGGGGGGDSYTKAETDELLAAKANKNYLTANNKIFNFAYDANTGKYGYKAGAQGEFHPFDDAGGEGLVLNNLVTTGLTISGWELVDGGYEVVDGIVYIDITLKNATNSSKDGIVKGLPTPLNTGSLPYGVLLYASLSDIAKVGEFSANSVYTRLQLSSGEYRLYSNADANSAFRIVMMYKAST